MNRTFISIVVSVLMSVGIISAVNIPVQHDTTTSGGGTQPSKTRMLIPLSVDLNDTDINICFTSPVGLATITITDETGSVVCQQSMDTDTDSVMIIPVGGFDSGNYTITIQYDTTSLAGYFVL